MDTVRKAIIVVIRTTDPKDPQAVKKAAKNLYILKRSLKHYETFKNSLLTSGDVD
jgi:hypothetical protein